MTIALGRVPKEETNLFDTMDDWLRRGRFIFVGWYGLLLFPYAYFSLGVGFYRNNLCCNFLTATISTFANSLAHSLLLLWGPEAHVDFSRWCQLGGFMLHQLERARSVQLRPCNAISFSGLIAIFVSVFLSYPLGNMVAIFRFILFFQGFHDWTLNLFHMMGFAGVLGVAFLCTIHGANIQNTLFEDGDGANTFRAFNPTQAEETYSMLTANRFWSQIFDVFFPINVGYISLSYFYPSPEMCAAEDREFEAFYTKNITLNEVIHAWMEDRDQRNEIIIFPRRFYHMETLFNGTFVFSWT
ncbi:hypothetical protein ZWY2020_006445 [Hordeum vulgare]|nr:hypothetical protein ZWY2020_006445 [Hordeum vulgare]